MRRLVRAFIVRKQRSGFLVSGPYNVEYFSLLAKNALNSFSIVIKHSFTNVYNCL